MNYKKDNKNSTTSTALTAVAFQDHLVKSLGLTDFIGPHHVPLGPAAKAKSKRPIKSVISTGKFGRNPPTVKNKETKEKEYVLDPKPSPLTLAQKLGLVDAPDQPLSETQWQEAKKKSNTRDDSKMPCVICKEDFGIQEQVLLSCTHVFHRACLQAFERFTGKKTCPMCRKEQYQTRVIHEGSRHHRHKCATMIQACWRGYVVRCMYRKLRESNPPKDPRLRKKFFEEKLHSITERMVKSCDFDVHSFLREMDSSLAASRKVFRDFDTRFQPITEDQWEAIQLRAVERENKECPICLTPLYSKSYIVKHGCSAQEHLVAPQKGKTTSGIAYASSLGPKHVPALSRASAKLRSGKQTKNLTKDLSVLQREKQEAKGPDSEDNSAFEGTGFENREAVLLSCSHVFHKTCLEMFEELSMETKNSCPICRSSYQKRIL